MRGLGRKGRGRWGPSRCPRRERASGENEGRRGTELAEFLGEREDKVSARRFAAEPAPVTAFDHFNELFSASLAELFPTPEPAPALTPHGRALLRITQAIHAAEVLPFDDIGKLEQCIQHLHSAGDCLDGWYAPGEQA